MGAAEFDNSDQTARIRARAGAYVRIGRRAVLSGVSPLELLRTKYPFRFPDQARPASLSVEITDACNLKCDYCLNPHFAYPRRFMDDATFVALREQLDSFRVDRIRICGGEPTLHPRFDAIAKDLAARTRFLSIVTNGQWHRAGVAESLVTSCHLIEVSIDAGGKDHYERVRRGASFERLLESLSALQRARDASASSAVINVRLMLRPTTTDLEASEVRRWSEFADCVMPQFLIDQVGDGIAGDVFQPVQLRDRTVPRCTMPFKDLAVRCDGSVPVCHVNGTALDPTRRIVLGNVRDDSLGALWSGQVLAAVRAAHRSRDESSLEFCRGCSGR